MPNAIALNSIQFNVARVIGPALGGIALAKLGDTWCFGLNGSPSSRPSSRCCMLKTRFIRREDHGIDSRQHETGHSASFASQGAMEALIVLAFLHDRPWQCRCVTFLPVFAKDIFHQRPGHVHPVPFHLRASARSWARSPWPPWATCSHKGRIALIMLICLGAGDRRLRPLHLGLAELRSCCSSPARP